jgi:hypothetical protein
VNNFLKDKLLKIAFEVLKTTKTDRVEVLEFKTVQGNTHNLFIQELDLQKERSVKILKTDLGELNSNLWIALVLLMKDSEPTLFLIPSTEFLEPDNFIFIENNQNPRLAHFSNYEIKVFKNGMSKLNEFRFENMINKLQ